MIHCLPDNIHSLLNAVHITGHTFFTGQCVQQIKQQKSGPGVRRVPGSGAAGGGHYGLQEVLMALILLIALGFALAMFPTLR